MEEIVIEDHKLIRKIKKGDKESFDILVRKHYNNIYSYCLRKTGNKEVASDLTQDTFLKLITSIDNYRYIGKFTNFLFTIAVNTCNDYHRKHNLEVVDMANIKRSAGGPSLDDIVIENEKASIIKEKLDTLPNIQKDAIILFYYHDMKIKDIAKVMDINLSTAKSRLKQGRDKLKRMLGGLR